MTATVALSAAIENRRHLIGSTRRSVCVAKSTPRRGFARCGADNPSLSAIRSKLI